MTIREAVPADAHQIAGLIILAMDDLAAKFAGESDPFKAIPLFEHFAALPGNQYSYENILVYEEEGVVCGMISAYDGADLEILRAPFLSYLQNTYGFDTIPEAETEAGEYYIDCISVAEGKQGRGIGKKLIVAMIKKIIPEKHDTIGLLVSAGNPQAGKLYSRLGFKIISQRHFMGGNYYHMQYHVDGDS
jgi:ribosomal protein S18 acetylase RimI-like enzyme